MCCRVVPPSAFTACTPAASSGFLLPRAVSPQGQQSGPALRGQCPQWGCVQGGEGTSCGCPGDSPGMSRLAPAHSAVGPSLGPGEPPLHLAGPPGEKAPARLPLKALGPRCVPGSLGVRLPAAGSCPAGWRCLWSQSLAARWHHLLPGLLHSEFAGVGCDLAPGRPALAQGTLLGREAFGNLGGPARGQVTFCYLGSSTVLEVEGGEAFWG